MGHVVIIDLPYFKWNIFLLIARWTWAYISLEMQINFIPNFSIIPLFYIDWIRKWSANQYGLNGCFCIAFVESILFKKLN